MSGFELTGFFDYARIGCVFAPDESLVSRIDESYAESLSAGFLAGRADFSVPSNLIYDTLARRVSAADYGPEMRLFVTVGSVFFKADGAAALGRTARHPVLLVPVDHDTAWGKVTFRSAGGIQPNLGLKEYFVSRTGIDIYKYYDRQPAMKDAVSSVTGLLDEACVRMGYRYDMSEINLVLADVTEESEYLAVAGCDKISSMPGFVNMDSIFARDAFAQKETDNRQDTDRLTRPDHLFYVRNDHMSRLLAVADAGQGSALLIDSTLDGTPMDGLVNLASNAVGSDRRMLVMCRDERALDQAADALDQAGFGDLYVRLTGDRAIDNLRIVQAFDRSIELFNRESSTLSGAKIAEGYQIVEQAREGIRDFYSISALRVGKAEWPLYHVYGSIRLLERKLASSGARIPTIRLEDAESWTRGDVEEKCSLVREFEEHIRCMGPIRSNPFWGSRLMYLTDHDIPDLTSDLDAMECDLAQVQSAGRAMADAVRQPEPLDMKQNHYLSEPVRYLSERPDAEGIDLAPEAWTDPEKVLNEARAAMTLQEDADALRRQTEAFINGSAEPVDMAVMEGWAEVLRAKRYNFFNSAHRRAKKQMKAYFTAAWHKLKRPDQLAVVEKCIQLKDIEDNFGTSLDSLSAVCGGNYPGIAGDYSPVADFAEWYMSFDEKEDFSDNEHVRDLRLAGYDRSAMASLLSDYEFAANRFSGSLKSFLDKVQLGGYEIIMSFRFSNILTQIRNWRDNLASLEEISGYNTIQDRLQKAGIAGVAQLGTRWTSGGATLSDAFLLNYYRALAASGAGENAENGGIDTEKLCAMLDGYSDMERAMPRINYDRAMLTYVDRIRLSARNSDFMKQYTGLHSLAEDRDSLAAYRDNLLDEYGRVIMTCLPIFIMPDHAASLIPSRAVFDTMVVPFGEAETPYSCLGGILRSRQLTVISRDRNNAEMPGETLVDALKAKGCRTRAMRPFEPDIRTAGPLTDDDRAADPFRAFVADEAAEMGLLTEKPRDDAGSLVMLYVKKGDDESIRPLAAIVSDRPEMTGDRSVREYTMLLSDALEREKIKLIRTSARTWGDTEKAVLRGI